tara:strand:- start:1120 stop:2136 length:1017 start_codon:yes stop_codon:yes gene_type:complete
MSGKQPIYDKDLQTKKVAENNPTVKELEALGVVVNTVSAGQGILSQGTPPSKIWYNRQKSDYIVGDIATAPIIMYQDRPVDSLSGYGGKGSNRSQTIDIVVGRMSSAREGKGPEASLTIDEDDSAGLMYGYTVGDPVAVVENSFAADAARIYISQLTDVDQNFGLAEGFVGKKDARSAVAIKADGVRIIGREGVKIVTGRSHAFSGIGMHGELLSTGGSIKQPAPPIELIAGNNDKYLQGVARGENTRDALRDLGERIEELYAVTFTLALSQLAYDASMGVSILEPWRPAAFPAVMLTFITKIILAVWISRASKKVFDLNFLQPFGYGAIASKNVFTN